MSDGGGFQTAVIGVTGTWPEGPAIWSYSSLAEAEECPRRWALGRASYPDVWAQAGYPPRANLPALVGDVVHRVLEIVIRQLCVQKCESLADPRSADVLRDLGGYTKLIEQAIEERLARLVGNPRMDGRLVSLHPDLRARVPDMRQRVQAIIARSKMRRAGVIETDREGPSRRGPLGEGSHPEVELRATNLNFVGRVDLITVLEGRCVITDYKTGAPADHHADQLNLYALLWRSDVELNPHQIPVGELVVSYTARDLVLSAPSDAALSDLAESLVTRIAEAERQLDLRPPAARPSAPTCKFCGVRQLCDEYWAFTQRDAPAKAPSRDVEFVDREATIVGQSGPRSWLADLRNGQPPALLRTPTETPSFGVGDQVRLLDLAVGRDEESGQMILTMTQASEVFVLESAR